MDLDATARRRWFGALALAAALVMLLSGQTLLKSRLGNVAFVVYWMVCFMFTGLAIFAAFLDFRALQHRTRKEHRELLQSTLDKIEADAKNKPTQRGRNEETAG